MPQTSLARLGKIVWKLLEEYGHDPEPLFLEVGLNPKLINNPDARMGYEVADKLWSYEDLAMQNQVFLLVDFSCVFIHFKQLTLP